MNSSKHIHHVSHDFFRALFEEKNLKSSENKREGTESLRIL